MPWSSKRRGPLESCSPATSKGSPSVLVSSPSREYARPPFLARLNFDTLPKWTKPETRLLLKFKIIARYLRRHFFIFFDLIFFRNPSRFFSLSFYTSSFVGNRCTVIICLEEEVERWAAGPTIVQISTNGIVISCVISRSKTNLATELRNQNSSCISRRPGLTKWLSGHARLKPVTCSLVAPVAWPPLEHENSTRCIG